MLTPTHTGPNAATQLPSRRHTPSFVILPTVVPEKNSGEASFTAILVATTALLAFSVSITAVVVVVIIYLRRRQRKTDLGESIIVVSDCKVQRSPSLLDTNGTYIIPLKAVGTIMRPR